MRAGRVLALAGVLVGVAAPSAHGAFHLMKVSEVFPGTALAPDRAFIELQMHTAGQNFVAGHSVTVYDAAGALKATVPMTAPVANGESQRTILLGDIDVTNRDFNANVGTLIAPAGGAVCFPDAQPPDCVAWGSFSAPGALPGAVGTPALPGGIPDGSSVTRSIAPNCPTLLEAADDTDNSSVDFLETATETPRNNATTPTEMPCVSPDTEPPNTTISKGPDGTIEKDTAKFKFRSDEAGSTFACKLDKGSYKSCTSPKKYKNLKDGKHKFLVRATDDAGNTDPSPDRAKFEVDTG